MKKTGRETGRDLVGYVARCNDGKLGLITLAIPVADGYKYRGIHLERFSSTPSKYNEYGVYTWESVCPKLIGKLEDIIGSYKG